MTSDIKALVAELEKLDSVATPAPWGASPSLCCRDRGTVSVQETGHTQPSHAFATWDADLVAATRNALPALLAELHRLWAKEARQDAIEEAAVRYREASEACQELKLSADMAAVNYAHRRNAEAREDLFAALPPRPSGGEEAKP